MALTKRRTREQIKILDAQIVNILSEDHPQSVRHVFYRMTNPRLSEFVEKTDLGYQQVQRRCLRLRRNGTIPYGWIADASRRGYHTPTYTNAGEFVERMASMYRGELWTRDLPHVEVWCESRSLAGVLQNECVELAVSLYPAGGFTSATLAWDAAREIDQHQRDMAVVLYVGDYDPAGVLIDRSIEKELRRHLETPLSFLRLGINEDQIEAYDLPTKPRKSGERRRLDIRETVEAEAMPAADIRRIVREAIERYLPDGVRDTIQVAEQSEQDGLESLGIAIDELGSVAEFMRHPS